VTGFRTGHDQEDQAYFPAMKQNTPLKLLTLFIFSAGLLSAQQTITLVNGSILKGKVIAATPTNVLVDLGFQKISIPISALAAPGSHPESLSPAAGNVQETHPRAGGIHIEGSLIAFSSYLQKITEIIQKRWDAVVDSSCKKPKVHTHVMVRFQLGYDGAVQNIVKFEGDTDFTGMNAALIAIETPAPYQPWTREMIAYLGQSQILEFTFFYQ